MEKPFYYRYLEGEFVDTEMYNTACLFMEQYHSSLNGSKYSRCKNAGTAILKYFAPIHIEELTSDFIIQLTSSYNLKQLEGIIINKFLLFMIDNGKIQDNIIKRITLFRERLNSKAYSKYFDTIFNCKRFNEFLNNNFFESSEGISIFFMKIQKENFLDEEIYKVLSDRLEEIKFQSNNKYTIKSVCRDFMFIAKEFFENVKLVDITLKHIHTCMVSLKNQKSYVISRRLSQILVLLESKGLIKDEEVLNLLSFKDYLLSDSCTLNRYIELTSGKNIKRFVCITSNYRQQRYLQYMKIQCQEVFDAWVKFYTKFSYRASFICVKTICTEFDDSLSEFIIGSLEDINFDTFYAQLKYFAKYKKKDYTAVITAFYMFLSQNYNPKIFEISHIDIRLLQRPKIAQELLEGYKVINYNPFEDVPEADRWLLSYSHMQDSNMAVNTTTSRIIDFTKIKSKTYRYWVKHFILKATGSVCYKLGEIYILIEFVNYIYDLKHGIELSIFAKKTSGEDITANEALAYKTYILNKSLKPKSQFRSIKSSKRFLQHVSCNKLSKIETGVFYNLKHGSDNTINAEALSNDDVNKLAIFMKAKGKNSITNQVYYAILCLTIETEFRSSQILALPIDCIAEANKKNQYVLISRTKTSKGELMEQALTIQTKRLLEHIIKLTSKYRKNCTVDNLKNQMFLLPAAKTGAYKIVSRTDFNNYLKKCCSELGLKKYNLSNLRDTHMTRVEDYITKNELSDMTKKILGGHASPRSDKNYEDTDIKTLLEAVHGIIIGNVDIKGQIIREVDSEIETDENTVCKQCGYCGAECCHDLSYLDCLMCSDFIATVSRIPFFEDQLRAIDSKFLSTTIKHDKEDLVNIKRLLLEYLRRLLILKKEYEKVQSENIEGSIINVKL